VVLDAVTGTFCPKCGDRLGISIPDEEGLEKAAAAARILIPVRLQGYEIRFLRRAIGLLGKELADLLAVNDATVSRWENASLAMGLGHDKLLRLHVARKLGDGDDVPGVDLDLEDIFNLRVPPVVDSGQLPVAMAFRRVLMKVRRKGRVEAWAA